MRPWTTVSCIVPKSLEAIDLTKVGAPALRQCAGVQHCDGSIHTGSPALSISGCIHKDEGLWGGSTVGRGGLGSAECPVACRYSSRLCCNHCCLQIGQAGAAVCPETPPWVVVVTLRALPVESIAVAPGSLYVEPCWTWMLACPLRTRLGPVGEAGLGDWVVGAAPAEEQVVGV